MTRTLADSSRQKLQLIVGMQPGETKTLRADQISASGKARVAANQLRQWINKYLKHVKLFMVEILDESTLRITCFDIHERRKQQEAGDRIRQNAIAYAATRAALEFTLAPDDATLRTTCFAPDDGSDLIGD